MLIYYVAPAYLISAALILIVGLFNRSWKARLFSAPPSKLGSLAFHAMVAIVLGYSLFATVSGIWIPNTPEYVAILLMTYYWTRGIALMCARAESNRSGDPSLVQAPPLK